MIYHCFQWHKIFAIHGDEAAWKLVCQASWIILRVKRGRGGEETVSCRTWATHKIQTRAHICKQLSTQCHQSMQHCNSACHRNLKLFQFNSTSAATIVYSASSASSEMLTPYSHQWEAELLHLFCSQDQSPSSLSGLEENNKNRGGPSKSIREG